MRKPLSAVLCFCLILSQQAPLFAAGSNRFTSGAGPTRGMPGLPALAPSAAIPNAAILGAKLPSGSPLIPIAPSAPAAAGAAVPGAATPSAAARALERALQRAPIESISQLPVEQARGAGALPFGEALQTASSDGPEVPAAGTPGAGGPGLSASAPQAKQPKPAPPNGKKPRKPFFLRYPALARLAVWPFVMTFYRIRVQGLKDLPDGPLLMLPNHVSYMDAVLLGFALKRPIRFMMKRSIYEMSFVKVPIMQPLLRAIFRPLFGALGAIPVSPDDARGSIKAAKQALLDGDNVVIFPEGMRTLDGHLNPFKRGFELIAKDSGASVVPIHLDGMWGSVFSPDTSKSLMGKLLEAPRHVTIRIAKPLEKADTQAAKEAMDLLVSEATEARIRRDGKTLPRQFLAAAKKFWGSRAIADSKGQDLTFGRTLTAAVLLSRRLRSQSKRKNVGVLVPPSAGGALANVALTIAGKVPVNIDYSVGPEAVAYAIEKGEIDTIVTSRAAVEAFQALPEWKGALPPGKLVYLEDILPTISKAKRALTYIMLRLLPRPMIEFLFFRAASRSLDDDAAILFTSGSGAAPKGVQLSHLNIRSNVQMTSEVFARAANDFVLGVLPFFHSFGFTATLWYPLMTGTPVAYHSSPRDGEAIGKLAEKYKPTIFFALPSLLVLYARKISTEAFANLRLMITGAEALRSDYADLVEKKYGVRPMEGYGATELSPVAALSRPDTQARIGHKDGTVGPPVPGVAIRAVDIAAFEQAVESGGDVSALPSVPWGQPGVLLVRGPNVMKGYFNDPERTAAALKNGWYITGDIGVIFPESQLIKIEGRVSRFSKIAGTMVSQVVVESKLQAASGVQDATFVVVGLPDAERGERLVVVYSGWQGDVAELVKKVNADGLPALWTPSRNSFHRVDEIPRLGSGKYDFKKVKAIAVEKEASK